MKISQSMARNHVFIAKKGRFGVEKGKKGVEKSPSASQVVILTVSIVNLGHDLWSPRIHEVISRNRLPLSNGPESKDSSVRRGR